MKTRKLLLPVLLTLGIVSCLAFSTTADDHQLEVNSKDRRYPKVFSKYRDKTSKGKYDPDFMEKINPEENEDVPQVLEDNSSGYKNNRAINVPSSEDSEVIVHQTIQSTLPAKKLKPDQKITIKGKKIKNVTIADGICQNVDIRNRVDNFEMLKDCRIIEGFLQIVLMDNNTETDFQNISFPKLREITGYLLLFRVTNLRTLNTLFPNLEVIRGDLLLTDYSFMIYELQNLQEIGLTKLTKILRGAVRIEKNPSLCYTNTIDWNEIVVAGENFIKDNGNPSSCPGCPSCPDGHCWTAKDCQKVSKPVCHPQCLADCFGPTDKDCYVCKNFRVDDRCVEKCPPHLYAYVSRRCITEEMCLKMNNLRQNKEDKRKWRTFNGLCISQCPDGYEETLDQNNITTCKSCNGTCRKVAKGGIIRHISDAQTFRGVTVIDGGLEFRIRNGNPNIINELTNAFGNIEEITGYLKVTHSFAISTLSFLKKLRVIKGEKLEMNNASLIILDNPNLSNLFGENQKIQITNGRMFFHYNPKLCMSKITALANMVGITNFTELEIQPDSNGEKVACDIVNINITVKQKGSSDATFEWEVYNPRDGQRLLSYLLNYIETENENITFEANSCGNNNWQIVDVEIPSTNSSTSVVSKSITDLKPYTKYAVYVKTLAVRNKNSFRSPTGQSEIIYFRTEADVPSVPTDVISFPASDSEIVVKWNPPDQPNGPIAKYIIFGYLRSEDDDFLLTRDYCKNGLVAPEVPEVPEVTVKTPVIVPKSESCCMKEPQEPTSKKFEIFCNDNMTISYLSHGKKNYCDFHRYIVEEKSNFSDSLSLRISTQNSDIKKKSLDDSETRIYNNTYYSFIFNSSANSSSYLLKKLRHYSLYTISVAACGEKLNNGSQLCSTIQYTNSRTKEKLSADNVNNLKAYVSNDTIVIITWEPVPDPNGLTVAYTIEYTNLNVPNAKKNTICIPEGVHRRKRGTYSISNLSPGKYSLRMRSTSLAGDGNWSQAFYFSIDVKDDNIPLISVLVALSILVIAIIAGYLSYITAKKKRQQARLIASVNPDYIESKYVRDNWEVPRESIKICEELGLGHFGMVYRGVLNGTEHVAIKTIPENYTEDDKNEFLNEASVMKNFSTYHIIKLLGVISEGNPPYVIMELMENGDLKSYLRRIRDTESSLEVSRIVRMAGEIADGMAYLESKKFVHRDLAARNCMVSKNLVCKIGDFGMARDIYETDYYKIGQKGLLPIRWMAPENLSDGVFTSDSDVWSFGVVLYEILTMGELPYQGFSNDDVLNHVLRKGIVNIPRNCPEIILKLMEKCFKWRPSERPTFMEIIAELEPFLAQDFCEKSFYHSEEGIETRNLGIKKVYHHAAPIRFHWGNETARWVREFEDNVTLLDQTRTGASRNRIFKNGFQHFGNVLALEDVPLDQ
ncbi:insulin-like receptor [Chelonus insularis]|uniref:insulin-like receptor n=1 Tax=Chelonus insularis TaxID=460826 RepID=UPI001589506D|nr:insulin-like receptor [Chelonus insularis]XP_034951871.1 insulin-like receptor [Chelonus insularis]XP_034951872.1 insulin-like receptor [Chelonus insularis]XP_034951873.1 insulin-like receptor [Chelonus insularis]XP_034951874.1 insulin-like receptor [Chelonus insularis]XP_034951875.1 insulin-like receptor [Chelonus insularis]XP_034951876.1 insulin-like receptor [Chelonus insularis]